MVRRVLITARHTLCRMGLIRHSRNRLCRNRRYRRNSRMAPFQPASDTMKAVINIAHASISPPASMTTVCLNLGSVSMSTAIVIHDVAITVAYERDGRLWAVNLRNHVVVKVY